MFNGFGLSEVINVNGDESVFFLFSIETSKCSGSCSNINYPCAKICVPDVVKNFTGNKSYGKF